MHLWADAWVVALGVLLPYHEHFEHPSPEEIAHFDRYVGPESEWHPA